MAYIINLKLNVVVVASEVKKTVLSIMLPVGAVNVSNASIYYPLNVPLLPYTLKTQRCA